MSDRIKYSKWFDCDGPNRQDPWEPGWYEMKIGLNIFRFEWCGKAWPYWIRAGFKWRGLAEPPKEQ